VWAGRCVRAGTVLGPQFYMFGLIFAVGAAVLAYNLYTTIRAARSHDLIVENQALTSANPGSVGPNHARAAGGSPPRARAREGSSATPKTKKSRETGATGTAPKPKATSKAGRGRRRGGEEAEMDACSARRPRSGSGSISGRIT